MTKMNATSNARIVIDLLALASAIIVVAGLCYCFFAGAGPIVEQSLTDDRYATGVSVFVAAALYLIVWFRQQS